MTTQWHASMQATNASHVCEPWHEVAGHVGSALRAHSIVASGAGVPSLASQMDVDALSPQAVRRQS